jgi:hypothetical protein
MKSMELEDREVNVSLVHKNARKFELDPYLMMAIIDTENGPWNIWASRYEDHYSYLVIPDHFAKLNHITVKTEQVLQKCSWGLAQIMGGTARYLGYQGPIPALLLPEINVYWMARLLAVLKKDFASLNDVISSYNQGSPKRKPDGTYKNQLYVDKVLKAYSRYTKR